MDKPNGGNIVTNVHAYAYAAHGVRSTSFKKSAWSFNFARAIFLLSFVCCTTRADYFEFLDNKKDGALDKNFIKRLVDTFHCDTFFETGTCGCDTTLNAAPYFKNVVTVELFKPLYQAAKTKLKRHKHVHLYYGKSPDTIREVGPHLAKNNVLFWLDAHYSGPGTALSNPNESDPEAVTAIRAELKAIKESGIDKCVILIDDIRGFGTYLHGQEYLGCWAYPNLQEVKASLLEINPCFEVALLGDILLAYDASKYTPQFSQTVIACTVTRLYDGYNLTNQELADLESSIMNAPMHEKSFIKKLYTQMTDYKDPMFWHDLWYGLVELGNKNFAQARHAFSKVKVRVQYFNKNRQPDSTVLHCKHPHVDTYLQIKD